LGGQLSGCPFFLLIDSNYLEGKNMAYKFSKGSQVIGDLRAADDTQRDTKIDFGEDQIDLHTSGTVRMNISNDGVYIPDTNQNASLFVSGGVEITPGNQEGLRFMKTADQLNFISFQDGDDGGSFNARLSYNSAEFILIAPGRGADFFINSSEGSGDTTFPFSIMDDGTARFEKGLTSVSDRAADLTSNISFFVSGTTDGNNNALFVGNVVMSASLGIGTATPKTTLDVHHNPTGLANDTGGGEVVKFGSGTLTTGKLYFLSGSTWTETDADAIATGADQMLGIALGSDPAAAGVLIRGFFDANSYLSNFSAGKAVYVSTTAGGMDTTAPSGGGDFVRIIGYCTTTANVIYFNPSTTWVEL
jgi:hypothetical protein